MNQKELNEIRRRFRLDKNNFSRIFGCYVNSNREVISWIDASLGLMRQEEQEMYLGLLKKDPVALFLPIPVLAVIATLLIATPVYAEFRYAYSLFCVLPFLLAVSL